MFRNKKILITGASGFLAAYWIEALNKNNNKITLLINKKKNKICQKFETHEVNKIKSIKKFFIKNQFDYVINTASLADVNLCEKKPILAKLVHEDFVKKIAQAAKKTNAYLIHISTDHIFSGKNKIYTEVSKTKTINVYARTKLNSERIIKRYKLRRYLIIRGNFFGFGPSYKKTFLDWIVNRLKKNLFIHMVDDVYFSPLYITIFIDIINKLILLNKVGIYNVSSIDRISKYTFALCVAKTLKLDDSKLLKKKK